ncbi:MAG: caspase family protein [Burkholderiales bacterium]|nr:caspase family protein [Burkholderiales bacterium]
MANARSIHVGLNYVDPDAYNGWNGELSGCINDARDMQAIADGLGYASLLLTDSEATSSRFISEVGQASADLTSGDILFLSYSGHGGQVDDVNGDEDDALDETWCLWDRQLIDDELFSLWSRFAAGVRIVMLSDSCHSGTVARMRAALQEMARDVARTRSVPTAAETAAFDSLSKVLGFDPAKPKKAVTRAGPYSPSGVKPSAVTLDRPKRVPPDIQALVNNTRAAAHTAAQWLAGPREKAVVGASVILISGCQDNQLSMDGAGNGLFTQRLKQVWNNGGFSGDYRAFWVAIKGLMPANQQPNYFTVGVTNPAFEAQSPFEVANGGGLPAPTPQPGPAPTGARPTIRQGSTGPDVEYLQSRLSDYGYHVTVDGSFGPITASAVRSFQSSCGLVVDGIVGPATWAALG